MSICRRIVIGAGTFCTVGGLIMATEVAGWGIAACLFAVLIGVWLLAEAQRPEYRRPSRLNVLGRARARNHRYRAERRARILREHRLICTWLLSIRP